MWAFIIRNVGLWRLLNILCSFNSKRRTFFYWLTIILTHVIIFHNIVGWVNLSLLFIILSVFRWKVVIIIVVSIPYSFICTFFILFIYFWIIILLHWNWLYVSKLISFKHLFRKRRIFLIHLYILVTQIYWSINLIIYFQRTLALILIII